MTSPDPVLKPCAHCGKSPRYVALQIGFYQEVVVCDTCHYSLPIAIWNQRPPQKDYCTEGRLCMCVGDAQAVKETCDNYHKGTAA